MSLYKMFFFRSTSSFQPKLVSIADDQDEDRSNHPSLLLGPLAGNILCLTDKFILGAFK